MDTAIIYRGKQYDIYSVTDGGRSYATDFIKDLQQNDQKKVVALLQRAADHGLPRNEERFHKLKGCDIYEFKSFQVRLLCFRDKTRLIILTHGFLKKGNSTPKNEIERAVKLQKEYLNKRKGSNNER